MQFWQQLLEKLLHNQRVYLLTVVDNHGSSPGRKGFRMLVAEDGYIFGSIGGGVMEYNIVEEIRSKIKEENPPIFIKKQVHRGQKENGSGMICSGEQSIAFHLLNQDHIPIIESLKQTLLRNEKGTLLLTSSSIEFSKILPEQKYQYTYNNPEDWAFQELIGFRSSLYIVGGGHVSVAVSQLFATLGFHVHVFDDRNQLNTLESNSSAHQKQTIDFNTIEDFIPEGPDSYVAIMTNRYIDDKLVLTKLLHKQFAYIGVLGSKAKLKTMWTAFKKEGIQHTSLDHVHAPIGLPIKSQTPHEIAVSIAAEVIKIKNINQ